MDQLTDIQFDRLCRQVYQRIERAFAGGLRYGLDWPTLRAVEPGWANVWTMLRHEHNRRRTIAAFK